MGILDDAIREHLDLKRQHGAREDELQSIEDDAFGSGERPDPFGEGTAALGGAAAPDAPSSGGSEPEDPTMLVEAPETAQPLDPAARPDVPPPAGADAPAETAPPKAPAPPPIPDAPADAGEEPGGLFDFETTEEEEGTLDAVPPPADAPESPAEPAFPGGVPAAPQPPPESAAAEAPPAEPSAPPESESLADLMAEDEEPEAEPEASAPETELRPAEPEPEPESLEEDVVEPPAASGVPDPPPPPPEPGTEPKGRARGRVHHPTEEHPAPEPDSDDYEFEEDLGPPSSEPLEPAGSSAAEEEASGVFDFETDAGEAEGVSDDFEELGPATDEAPYEEDEGDSGDRPAVDVRPADTDEEDLLAGSPDFVDEEAEDDEDLWFEKGPPKDFDFEDEK